MLALGVPGDANSAASTPPNTMTNPLDIQINGTHYKDLPIQPVQYIHANKMGFCEGNIVKYITRYRSKGGKADLLKVIHYAQLLIELEYGNADE